MANVHILRARDANADRGEAEPDGLDETLYYLTDANMNVTAVLDGSAGSATLGQVAQRYVYTPYGEATAYYPYISGPEDFDDCSDWTSDANVTLDDDTTDPPQGDASMSLEVGADFTTGWLAASGSFTAVDLSGQDGITIWVKSNVALAAGGLSVVLSESAGGAKSGVYIEIFLPAIAAGQWQAVTVSADLSALDAVISVGLYLNSDPGPVTLNVDALAPGRDTENEVLYCGYRYDPETGLDQARHRYHMPETGHWVGRDPVGYVDGLNLYQYVRSHPANSTDPTGRDLVMPEFGRGRSLSLTYPGPDAGPTWMNQTVSVSDLTPPFLLPSEEPLEQFFAAVNEAYIATLVTDLADWDSHIDDLTDLPNSYLRHLTWQEIDFIESVRGMTPWQYDDAFGPLDPPLRPLGFQDYSGVVRIGDETMTYLEYLNRRAYREGKRAGTLTGCWAVRAWLEENPHARYSPPPPQIHPEGGNSTLPVGSLDTHVWLPGGDRMLNMAVAGLFGETSVEGHQSLRGSPLRDPIAGFIAADQVWITEGPQHQQTRFTSGRASWATGRTYAGGAFPLACQVTYDLSIEAFEGLEALRVRSADTECYFWANDYHNNWLGSEALNTGRPLSFPEASNRLWKWCHSDISLRGPGLY